MRFLHTDKVQVVKIGLQGLSGAVYNTWSISWLLMVWWWQESGQHQVFYLSSSHTILTLVLLIQKYSRQNRSILWLLISWLFTLPRHQQLWYWLCRINKIGFQLPVPSQCWEIIENVNMFFKFLEINSAREVLTCLACSTNLRIPDQYQFSTLVASYRKQGHGLRHLTALI